VSIHLLEDLDRGYEAPNSNVYLPDGLYRIEAQHFVAGFVVEDGRITALAPILRNKFRYFY
jgi:hypothetical protein